MNDTETKPPGADAGPSPKPTRKPRSEKATIGKLLRVPDAALEAALEATITEADRKAGASPAFCLRVLGALHASVLAAWHREESVEAHLLRDLAARLGLDDPRARWDAAAAAGELELDASGQPIEKRPSSRSRDRVGRACRVLDRAAIITYRPHRSRRRTPDAWAAVAYGPLLRELAGLSEAPPKLSATVEVAVPSVAISSGWPTETVGQLAYRNGGPIPRSSTEEKPPLNARREAEADRGGERAPRSERPKAPRSERPASPTAEAVRDAIRRALPEKHRSRATGRSLEVAVERLAEKLDAIGSLDAEDAIGALELGGARAGIGRDRPHDLDAIGNLPAFLAAELGKLSARTLEELAEAAAATRRSRLENAVRMVGTYRELGEEPPAWALELLEDTDAILEPWAEVASEAAEPSGWSPPPPEVAATIRRTFGLEPDAIEPADADTEGQASPAELEPSLEPAAIAEAGQPIAYALHDPAGIEPAVQLFLPRTIAELEAELRRAARAGTRAEVRRSFLEVAASRSDPPELAEAWADLALGAVIRELSPEEADAFLEPAVPG